MKEINNEIYNKIDSFRDILDDKKRIDIYNFIYKSTWRDTRIQVVTELYKIEVEMKNDII